MKLAPSFPDGLMWQCSNAYEQCEIDGNLGAARQLSRKGEMPGYGPPLIGGPGIGFSIGID
jgi:hypothetical protein